ncbi:preprotein translocase subunit SecA [Poriferisphaera corsica]|uniref:Protein translocase subunit SecA n=2 Tax=Poriferisphaera corsica TaxID=2528020 RepID=A0A517YU16_9BACT|nr:preprotein translocase subunit SecA [Poriferisphaera corsica]QDU33718.1 preprotein translocase subunit SecA [Poriferisphaera corsica]
MFIPYVSKAFTSVFGSRNERLLKQYQRRVMMINELEGQIRQLTDSEIKAKTAEFQERVKGGENAVDMLPEVMAVAREAMDRAVGMRNIFNDAHEFDASKLPAELQGVYAEIKAKADALEPEPVLGGAPAPGYLQVDVPNAIYDAVRELYPLSKPPFRARPFDVQLIGGMVLGEGKIAEMKTGEGKTIVAPLACYVACVDDLKCHVVTVNDYLVQRDRDWVFPFYYALGLTVGAIHPYHMQPPQEKVMAYQCNVLYATNSELGFDYLRDNMKLTAEEQVQKRRDFVIVDEIDSILVDEARTPLIISGPAHQDAPKYGEANKISAHLVAMQKEWDAKDKFVQQTIMKIKGLEGDIRNARDKAAVPAMKDEMKQLETQLPELEADRDQFTQYYEVEIDKKAVHLTHEGIAEAQKEAGVGSFYVGQNMDFPHLLENALRAHVVYKRDKDYVVREGEVIIVDEFTGRLMIGRQWSDGLHQAVESKESVKIKEETQTLATVTIQNFFKLYKRLAGMTGTAVTEATEFLEIYGLEVICIPTNLPISRTDRDDLIYLSEKDKWNAIVDEIKRTHDVGRPVLVGTTSVERSEMLSRGLKQKYGIKHEVLNAKVDQAERESNIVANAGELGAVMIATNMAGRGTDIRLGQIGREQLVKHWQLRNMLPKSANAEMGDEELVAAAYRHLAVTETELDKKEAAGMSDDELKLEFLRYLCAKDAWTEPKKARGMNLEQCEKMLDGLPEYYLHRLTICTNIEEMGGLHIIGTERHESRRIDNQLRGRSGRQGDQGSSRFFISLEDDLMKMFAGKTTLSALSKLGMKEGDAIEHRWVTKSVERAQRKVEERNYEIRKNLLEYDEVMEYQRNTFYGIRQDVLEGKNVRQIIFEYITESVADAVDFYKDKLYAKRQVAEWVKSEMDVMIEPSRLHLEDLEELKGIVLKNARGEIGQIIDVTIGEYLSDDLPPAEWDVRGLVSWAKSRFDVKLNQGEVSKMNSREVSSILSDKACEQIDKTDFSGVAKYLEKHLGEKELAAWARNKFGVELVPQDMVDMPAEECLDMILDKAREAYQQRELNYPIEFILDIVYQGAQQDQNWAVDQLINWVKQRYDFELSAEEVDGKNGKELFEYLRKEGEPWILGDKLETQIKEEISKKNNDPMLLAQWFRDRFNVEMEDELFKEKEDIEGFMIEKGEELLRLELGQLERYVLLQILDQAWKDHLYGMDQLKDSVGLRGYAEKDPRIEYKREGANHFLEMQKNVRDRVTDLIFRARLTPNVQVQNAYAGQQEKHEEFASAAAGQGTDSQQQDMAAADKAGGEDEAPRSRRARRAKQARGRHGGEGGESSKPAGKTYKQRRRKR